MRAGLTLLLGLLLLIARVPSVAARPAGPIYAVLGVDEDLEGAPFRALRLHAIRRRADSIVLLTTVAGQRARALWLPRDTLVRTAAGGEDILGHALRRGGIAGFDRVLRDNFGISLSGHVVVDFQGFAEGIDALGGVRMPDGHRVDGRRALGLVRVRRGDPRGDLGRIGRQMALAGSIARSARVAGPLRIVRTLVVLSSAIRTDIGPAESFQTAYAVSQRGVDCALLPGTTEGMRYRPTRDAAAFARRYLFEPTRATYRDGNEWRVPLALPSPGSERTDGI